VQPERRHLSNSTSASSWTAPGLVRAVLDMPTTEEELKSVSIQSAQRASCREEGRKKAYSSAALSGFCIRTIIVWIPAILLVLRVGHLVCSIDERQYSRCWWKKNV
jgi:hypothetical protein